MSDSSKPALTTAREQYVRFFADLIKDGFSLCNFLGKTEREVMVAQTVHACRINLNERGDAFSFKVPLRDGPHADNKATYQWCLDEGLFREELREPGAVDPPNGVVVGEDGRVVVIIPTERLFAKLTGHFGTMPPLA